MGRAARGHVQSVTMTMKVMVLLMYACISHDMVIHARMTIHVDARFYLRACQRWHPWPPLLLGGNNGEQRVRLTYA